MVASLAPLISAQDPSNNETIWASVIYTFYGDRTPLVWPLQNVLTSLGAKQLYSAGSFFRQRYLTGGQDEGNSGLAIDKISTDIIDSSEIFIMSTAEQFVGGSTIAFMQGLYPPTNTSTGVAPRLISSPVNESAIQGPLGNYQYPQLFMASSQDPNQILINGHVYCPLYYDARSEFDSSEEAMQIKSRTQEFYDGFQLDIFNETFPGQNISFGHAYLVFDYLNYGYVHDENVDQKLSVVDLARVRDLADQQVRAWNGYSTGGEPISGTPIQTIAGQTLAAKIVQQLVTNLQSQGGTAKLNLLFGSFEPLVSFSALTGVAKANTALSGLPNPGSSMVVEMYSNTSDNGGSYPDPKDLYVRFLFRNGTDSSSRLVSYPLFGEDNNHNLSLNDFLRNTQNLSIATIADWCSVCQSDRLFCAAFSSNGFDGNSDLPLRRAAVSGAMKPVVAGIIGAIVALAVASIIFALFILVGGFRLNRSRGKQNSELGGFKAGEKRVSDQDVPDNQSGVGAMVVSKNDDRVHSWELQEQGQSNDKRDGGLNKPDLSRRPSYETEEVGPYHSIEPTKVDERI